MTELELEAKHVLAVVCKLLKLFVLGEETKIGYSAWC